MTIQINKDWRIREANSGLFRLEEKGGYVCSSKTVAGCLASYVLYAISASHPLDGPQTLIALLSKLQDEIKGCVK